MRTSESTPRTGEARNAPLDGLRGVACLLVVLGHFFPTAYSVEARNFSPLLASWAEKFEWGVDLFFVISGFLIGGILLDHSPSRGFKKAFYIRRIVRIWPLYYFLVVVVMGGQYLAGFSFQSTVAPWWTYLLFLQNFWTMTGSSHIYVSGPTWSLAIEEFFYLLAPLYLVGASATKVRWLTLVTMGACVTCRVLLNAGIISRDCGGILTHLDPIAIGVLGASLARKAGFQSLVTRWWTRRCTILVIALLVGFASLPRASTALGPLKAVVPDGVAFLFLGIVLFVWSDGNRGLARILSTRVLTVPGRYCYFIYLFHLVILENSALMLEGTPYYQTIAVRLIALALILIAAPIVWRLIEQPSIRWARRRWPYSPINSAEARQHLSKDIDGDRKFPIPQVMARSFVPQ